MKETPRHVTAFSYYCTMPKRNLRLFAKDFGVSLSTAGNWSTEFKWSERAKDFDRKAIDQLTDVVVKDWVETKAYLLRVLMKQVIDGVDAGVKPKSTGEMVAAIREIRSIMGEDVSEDACKRLGIVFTREVVSGEEGTGNSDL